ncbi:eCIS core domain-containing protein [Saccharopolyspora shandongensis]|uniref:eCIS core domain-containing protein n=1 Tax=Saccharopolyspora shandongensis TaxID=418495 RepID=UPI0033C94D0E
MHDRHNSEAESSERERRTRAPEAGERPGAPGSAEHILHLQRTLGNAAVARAIADARSGGVEEVQRSTVHEVLRSSGAPLDEPVRTDMESRLGADFSDVRLHTGPAAQRSAAEIGARAYTSGNHIVVGEGGADAHTLAHELTHVIQQRSGPVAGTDNGNGLRISDPSDRFEREAEQNAKHVMALSHPNPVANETDSQVARGALQRAPSNPGTRDEEMTNEEWFGTTPSGARDEQGKFQTHASLIYTDDSGQDNNLLSATNVPASADEEGMHAEDLLIAGLRGNLDKFKPGPHRYHRIVFSVTKSPCTSESRDGLPATSKKGKGCTEAILELATKGIQHGDQVYKFKIVLIVRGLYHARVRGGKKASSKALDALAAHPQIEVSRDLTQKEIDELNADS